LSLPWDKHPLCTEVVRNAGGIYSTLEEKVAQASSLHKKRKEQQFGFLKINTMKSSVRIVYVFVRHFYLNLSTQNF